MSIGTTIMVVVLAAALAVVVLAATVIYLVDEARRRREHQRIAQQSAFALMRLRRLQHEAERQMHHVAQTGIDATRDS